MVAGPMERNSKPRRSGSVVALGGGAGAASPPRPCAHTRPATPRQAAARINSEDDSRVVFPSVPRADYRNVPQVERLNPSCLLQLDAPRLDGARGGPIQIGQGFGKVGMRADLAIAGGDQV